MKWILNLRIGTKLALASVAAALLVGSMIASQLIGNSAIKSTYKSALEQQIIARDAIDAKASIRGMQTGTRDLRLATTPMDLQKANEYLSARLKSMLTYADEMLKLSHSADNRARIEHLKAKAGDYFKGAQQIAALRKEAIGAGTAGSPDGVQKIAKLNDEAVRIAREVTLPIAAELEQVANQVADFAKHRVQEENAEAAREMVAAERVCLAVGICAMLMLLGTWLFSFMTIVRPMRALTAAMDELAGGNFAVVLPGLGRKDEVGGIAGAVEKFKVVAEQKARDEAETKRRQDEIAVQQRKTDMVKLADQFESAVGEIVEAVSSASTELEASAVTLTATAERSQELTTTVAAASGQASANVQSVASATEELSSSVTEISRQVQESARIANEAVDQARVTNDRVGELSKAAGRIGDVVDLINTIAGQTNLLALNATIEAARAGDAGRGFAVVASEVKALAEQTAKATGEISQQIAGIQGATEESVTAIKEISCTIERLSEISSTIAAAVEEQGAATQEISRNVQQAAQGTQQVSANITDVQRGAGETGSASSQVLSAAQMLSGDSNRLKVEVSKFLSSVRAV
ncbi:HAMP domain-containing protein [Bradyrhizobium sp. AUGA SZCCT0240]|uniref:methyl-accepting chemotaxis protein n=1 Tax=unclassified Bradyrhizobium TaxID=2631580 RepID=UPI001BAB7D31|nr:MULTISPECIES: HAMP domain-containing methyl-accepting chemotaxis protein [unclassified Bradyrhizobium]MBR1192079.1 HAMP domain-containing protein [Bradyrhizobium sp. AUGA SZCCT0160]MBR1194450.1 HAMP domain-containing protein [Bradyrhizobium sp. AUGA SZCCT0158]MBR1245085.1 HAMP domain-containing protein [Bradyrhizobium sp. AUGA SZCCT0274]MBR1252015.1 HAMP domain-containing protein [Bradyrhizobium sp. AUGA SZCCT0169]MBR1252844.1 HAMP domain-containing protein [Bradyrhizobium sp. AUGA SZCCT024